MLVLEWLEVANTVTKNTQKHDIISSKNRRLTI